MTSRTGLYSAVACVLLALAAGWAITWSTDFRPQGKVVEFTGSAPPPAGAGVAVEATLNLDEHRPCIPVKGLRQCDVIRAALWNGDPGAWSGRGIFHDDDRFAATVLYRLDAGDPATVSYFAKSLNQPYLRISRVRFADGQEITLTNLGGGTQNLAGWTLSSESAGLLYSFRNGVSVDEGGQCTVSFSGSEAALGGDGCRGTDTAAIPSTTRLSERLDTLVLRDARYSLTADVIAYNADPRAQPAPPNLIIARQDQRALLTGSR